MVIPFHRLRSQADRGHAGADGIGRKRQRVDAAGAELRRQFVGADVVGDQFAGQPVKGGVQNREHHVIPKACM
jgi:hypothetical protein